MTNHQPPTWQEKILIVDDEESMREWLALTLRAQGYSVIQAASGEAALEQVVTQRPDLILLDILMPGVDGFEVTARLKADPFTVNMPIIMVTRLDDPASRVRGLEAGADEFLTKPVDASELIARVRNLLRVKSYSDALAQRNMTLADEVRRKTTEVRTHCIDTVMALMRAAEYRDEATGTHVARISRYSTVLCERLGLASDFSEQMFYASPMHDIGKLAIPDSILCKPGTFNDSEWSVMKSHTLLGKKILEGANSPYLTMGSDIALYHHECWDGSGYPFGLHADQIPLAARIMTVCDVYDALRSDRPYKPALDHDVALAIMRDGDNRTYPGRFDPAILNAFFVDAGKFAAVYEEGRPPA